MSEYTKYSLRDIWHAAQTERNFNYAFWMEVFFTIGFETVVDSLGAILIGTACCLIAAISFCGFFIIIPTISESWSPFFVFNVVFGKNFMDFISLLLSQLM